MKMIELFLSIGILFFLFLVLFAIYYLIKNYHELIAIIKELKENTSFTILFYFFCLVTLCHFLFGPESFEQESRPAILKEYIMPKVLDDVIHSLIIEILGAMIVFISIEKGTEFFHGLSFDKRKPKDIINLINNSQNNFRILDTFLIKPLLDAKIIDAIRNQIEKGINIEILLLNPDSYASLQRKEDLKQKNDGSKRSSSMQKAQWNSIKGLYELKHSLKKENKNKLNVKLYSSSTSIALYGNEKNGFCGFYQIGIVADEIDNLKFSNRSNFFAHVSDHFNKVWDQDKEQTKVISIEEFMKIRIQEGSRRNGESVNYAIDSEDNEGLEYDIYYLMNNKNQNQFIYIVNDNGSLEFDDFNESVVFIRGNAGKFITRKIEKIDVNAQRIYEGILDKFKDIYGKNYHEDLQEKKPKIFKFRIENIEKL